MKKILTLFAILSLAAFTAGEAYAANGRVTANLYQDVPGTALTLYTLTGWAGAEANYIGLSDPTVSSLFALDFFDSSSALIGTASQSLVPGLGSTGNPFGYDQYSVSALAPLGTASVRARATMANAYANPAGGSQAFVVDAFELTTPAGGNLLSNPDLDVIAQGDQALATPVGGWHVNASRVLTGPYDDAASSEGFANVQQAGGFGLFFKAFAGDTMVVPEPTSIALCLLGMFGMFTLARRRG